LQNLIVLLVTWKNPLWLTALQILFLFLVFQELEDPVVLDLSVRWQVLFHEDQGMHLPEERVAPWVVKLHPEVLALDLELQFPRLLFFDLSQLVRSFRAGIGNELIDAFLDELFLLDASVVLGLVLDDVELLFEAIPSLTVVLLSKIFDARRDNFDLLFGLRGVLVPVKHLLQEVTLVLRLLEQAVVVCLVAHDGNILNVLADLVRHEVVHQLGICERVVCVGHQTLALHKHFEFLALFFGLLVFL